jgi:hypothetical protein
MEKSMSEPANAARAAAAPNAGLLQAGRLASLSVCRRRSFAAALLEAIRESELGFDDFAAEAGMPAHRLASLTSGRTVPTPAEAFNLWAVANWRRWAE